MSTRRRRLKHPEMATTTTTPSCQSAFHRVLQHSPPSLPPSLLRALDRHEPSAVGRVKVLLRVVEPNSTTATDKSSFLQVDARKKQLTIYEPPNPSLGPSEERRLGIAAPKMFAFDSIFGPNDSQMDVCSRALVDVIPAVVNGLDACLFSYGYSKLGKTYTMVGDSETAEELGIVPCAIWWLFKLISEQKQRTGARFSVRVSATEVAGRGEVLRDLLASHAKGTEGCGFSPGLYLRDEAPFGLQLQNQCELRAPSAERAAYYLDAALAGRSTNSKEYDGVSHLIFTFHVYQYRMSKSGKGGMDGGRSRLHFVDLGGCERQSLVYSNSRSYRLSMANLGNVILAIFNGQKHVPYKDSKLTRVLREILGNVTCQASMIAHVSPSPNSYTESVATIQLASRIHRLRHKKWKHFHAGGGGAEGLSEDPSGHVQQQHQQYRADGLRSSSSDFDYTSSDTCDTVIFVGSREKAFPDGMLLESGGGGGGGAGGEVAACLQSPPPVPRSSTRVGFAQIRQVNLMAGSFGEQTSVGGGSCCYVSTDERLMRSPNGRLMEDVGRSRIPRPLGSVLQRLPPPPPPPSDANHHRVPAAAPLLPVVSSSSKHSDEFWVDGPRRLKQVPDVHRSGGRFGPETWVDGPRVSAAAAVVLPAPVDAATFLDNHKKAMIERWIAMQCGGSREDVVDGAASGPDALFARAVDRVASRLLHPGEAVALLNEVDVLSNVDSIVSSEGTATDDNRGGGGGTGSVTVSNEDVRRSVANVSSSRYDVSDDCYVSSSTDNYEEDDVLSRMVLRAGRLDDDDDGGGGTTVERSDEAIPEEEEEDDDESEVLDERLAVVVATTDSWVQVNEEDILGAPSRRRHHTSFVDHPLRVLSSESLAVSFTNASSRSWDSGLNAARRAMHDTEEDSLEDDEDFGAASVILDHELDALLEMRSVHSEPGSSLPSSPSSSVLARNFLLRTVSCTSLKDVAAGTRRSRRRRRRTSSKCSDAARCCFCDDDDDDCSCCCSQCDLRILRRRPDGASDPHLERHPSALCLLQATTTTTEEDGEVEETSSSGAGSARWKCLDRHHRHTKEYFVDVASQLRFAGSARRPESSSATGFEHCATSDSLQDSGTLQDANVGDSGGDQKSDLAPCEHTCGTAWFVESAADGGGEEGTRESMTTTTADHHRDSDSGTGSSSSSSKTKKTLPSSAATSSGYDSMPRGSECSASTVHDAVSLHSEVEAHAASKENDGSSNGGGGLPSEVPRTILLDKDGLECFELSVYDEDDVKRMEKRRELEMDLQSRRHRSRLRFLRSRQEDLKRELELAKRLLMVEDDKWSYELRVEENLDPDDPGFLEAFERETVILEKRTAACKSHLMLVTCFDVEKASIED